METWLKVACAIVVVRFIRSVYRSHKIIMQNRADYEKRRIKFLRDREYIDTFEKDPGFDKFWDYIESMLNPMEIKFPEDPEEEEFI